MKPLSPYKTTWHDGVYLWHYFDSPEDAAAACLPGRKIVESAPGMSWRAPVAVDPIVQCWECGVHINAARCQRTTNKITRYRCPQHALKQA